MNGLVLLLGSLGVYLLGYFIYGRFLRKLFGIDANRRTPAHTINDGVDYVPTRPFVLFGHHFASIAGAGPIVGPIMAAYFGWGPVMLWLLVGCIFVGAMHDMAAMTLSLRHEGRSIASVIEEYVGFLGRQLFLVFCWSTLILVIAVFAGMIAKAFLSTPSVATSSILFILISPLFGWLVYRKGFSLVKASMVFVPIIFAFVYIGTLIPLDLVSMGLSADNAMILWVVLLMVYAAAASTLPVWFLLQPRDYLNSYLLYAMLLFGFLGIIFYNPSIEFPVFTGFEAKNFGGVEVALFPALFITIACGACSGFHSLVASGTSAKQIDNENHVLPVAYGGMLVEGILGVVALISVAYLSINEEVLKTGNAPMLFASGLAEFGTKLGLPKQLGMNFVSLAVSAFLLTTLDTSTRLARFMLQELFIPSKKSELMESNSVGLGKKISKVFRNVYVATGITVLLSYYMASSGDVIAVWPVFGATNQLLAALTLLVASLWLIRKKATPLVAIVPMLFMMCVSGTGLYSFISRAVKILNGTIEDASGFGIFLGAISCILFLLSFVLILLSVKSIIKEYMNRGK